MSIPRARDRLRDITARCPPDIADEILSVIDEEMFRRPQKSQGRRTLPRVTAGFRDYVKREFPKFAEAGGSQLDFVLMLRERYGSYVNPGRISEILQGDYDDL